MVDAEPEPEQDGAREELQNAILEFVRRPGYRPMKPRLIARHLHVPRDDVSEVKRAVKRLVRKGLLVYGAKHYVSPAEAQAEVPRKPQKSNRVAGVFRRAEKGFGFVRPSGVATGPGDVEDIYIAAPATRDAATGDMVLVELVRRAGRFGLPEGEIVEILERETHDFVGTYFEHAGGGYVQVDGTVFAQPIYVGDPGAKGAQPDDKVVVEMVRFPSHVRDGEGVITEVLGPRGKPGVDTLSVIREFHLPERFPDDVLEEARQAAEDFDESIPEERLDLTGETIVTIDPADARDFDDAISLTQEESGHWRLGVHIADVSHFVRPRTALDRDSQYRATSVYLPDRVVPMLPEVISNALASLQPDKVRYTKSVFIEFTPEGVVADTSFHNSAIRSTKRLNYDEVDQFLADREAWRRKLGAKVHELLGRMHELAMLLRRRRFERGALELTLREVKVELDADGQVTGARVVENTESHQIIEEFMLAANEAVARWIESHGLAFLRRVHKPPSLRKMKILTEFIRELGLKTESLESRFALQRLIDSVSGKPEQQAVNFAVLRSFQRAVYSPAEEGHYALASDCYCHFTSPIRRYPDLTVHRLFNALLTKQKVKSDLQELVALGQHCSDQEERSEAAERELTKLKLLGYLSNRLGEEMEAIITGVESFGLFVQGIDLPAEGLIPIASLHDDYYFYDRAAHTLSGRREGNTFRLGDPVRVAVARVDLERRELDFQLVGRRGRRPGAKAETARQRGAKKGPPKKHSPKGGKRGRRG
jgi:ribonuclease R